MSLLQFPVKPLKQTTSDSWFQVIAKMIIPLLNSNVALILIEILQSLRSFRMTVSAFVILSEAKNLARVMLHFNSELILEAIFGLGPHFGIVLVLSEHPIIPGKNVNSGFQMQSICQFIVHTAAIEQLPVVYSNISES